jgi:hypothetical protein
MRTRNPSSPTITSTHIDIAFLSSRSEQARWDMSVVDLSDDLWLEVFESQCEDWEMEGLTKEALSYVCVCRRWKAGQCTSQRRLAS